MSNHLLASGPNELVTSGATRQVVVHVDVGVLTGESPEGRCFLIRKVPGGLSFETHDGHVIGSRVLIEPVIQEAFPYETARAEWGGGDIDFDHLMCVLPYNMELAEARAAPPNSS